MRVDLHSCFLLHKKAYRETSLLLEVFSKDYGRVGLVAKGAVTKKKLNQSLQPFMLLQIAWSGRSELGNLTCAEPDGMPVLLSGDKLFSGYYLNELLIRLLHRNDPHQGLFDVYQHIIEKLAITNSLESTLRLFEKKLLDELGYGLILDHDIETGDVIKADGIYDYIENNGPILISSARVKVKGVKVKGKTLLSLLSELDIEDKESRSEAKRLMRFLLAPLLGDRPLHSRRIFETMKTYKKEES